MSQLISLDFEKARGLSRTELEKFILELEKTLSTYPQAELKLEHFHANASSDDGVYGRQLFIPKDTLLVGKIHRLQCINVVTHGEVSVLSIDGLMRLKAGDVFVSSPGAKRVIYAHEDSSWTTFHATGETDQEKIESKFTLNNYSELTNTEVSKLEDNKCHSQQ